MSRTIRAKVERVFDVATNYDTMHDSMPDCYHLSRTRSRRANVAVVHARIAIFGEEWRILAKHVTDDMKSHTITIIGGDGRGSRITETYESVGDSTKLTISADMKRSGFFGAFRRISERECVSWLDRVAEAIERASCC